jgi:VIT1/CCC1 family predicted Fe2+/Mn2+ transporter
MKKLLLLLKKILSLLPTPLPVGITEFNEWSDSIIDLSGEYADRDSMKYALASMVIHLGPQRSVVSKNYFVRSLRKAAANQVASQVFQDIKVKQQKQQEEAAKNEQQKEGTTGA